jgi:hypothetical protein
MKDIQSPLDNDNISNGDQIIWSPFDTPPPLDID